MKNFEMEKKADLILSNQMLYNKMSVNMKRKNFTTQQFESIEISVFHYDPTLDETKK